MNLTQRQSQAILWLLIIGFLILALLFAWQFITLRKAHSSLANYAAFRGCASVAEESGGYAICGLPSGQSIKLVQFRNRWYLDKDLPVCFRDFCPFL